MQDHLPDLARPEQLSTECFSVLVPQAVLCAHIPLACGLSDAQSKLDALVAMQPVALDREPALGGIAAAAVTAGGAAGLGRTGSRRLRRATRRGLAAAHSTGGDGAGCRCLFAVVCSRGGQKIRCYAQSLTTGAQPAEQVRQADQCCGAGNQHAGPGRPSRLAVPCSSPPSAHLHSRPPRQCSPARPQARPAQKRSSAGSARTHCQSAPCRCA